MFHRVLRRSLDRKDRKSVYWTGEEDDPSERRDGIRRLRTGRLEEVVGVDNRRVVVTSVVRRASRSDSQVVSVYF